MVTLKLRAPEHQSQPFSESLARHELKQRNGKQECVSARVNPQQACLSEHQPALDCSTGNEWSARSTRARGTWTWLVELELELRSARGSCSLVVVVLLKDEQRKTQNGNARCCRRVVG